MHDIYMRYMSASLLTVETIFTLFFVFFFSLVSNHLSFSCVHARSSHKIAQDCNLWLDGCQRAAVPPAAVRCHLVKVPVAVCHHGRLLHGSPVRLHPHVRRQSIDQKQLVQVPFGMEKKKSEYISLNTLCFVCIAEVARSFVDTQTINKENNKQQR